MVLGEKNILLEDDLVQLKIHLFKFFQGREAILENFSAQENMQKWINHHIADAKSQGKSSVDVIIWPESGHSLLGSSNNELLEWVQSQGYTALINVETTKSNPIPFIRTVLATISWSDAIDK